MPLPISGQSGQPAPGPEGSPYDMIGGETGVAALVQRFYDHMDSDPAFARIRELHQDDLASARQKLFEFLSGWLGGPQLFIEKYGHPRLRGRHMPFPIGDLERDEWIACMRRAMDDNAMDGPLRQFLEERFRHVASFMRNQEP
ncbi:MAG: group II truncated hemoglobin [Planctomycetota bacterium]